jgi:hypothetical protein
MKKIIGYQLRLPNKSNEPLELRRQFCSCPSECPLLKKGQCIHCAFLSACVYGEFNTERGPTKRANAYPATLSRFEEITKGNSCPSFAPRCLCTIGEYVYFPYSHADMCIDVPFVRHSHIFQSGTPFIKTEAFTSEVIVKLAAFRPQSLMGGEIKAYQEKQVPLFLLHLKHGMPELYNKAVELDKTLVDKTLKTDSIEYVDTTLDAIPPGQTDGYVVVKFPVHSWDGKTLKLKGPLAELKPFLSEIAGENAILQFEPDTKKTKVRIYDKKLIEKAICRDPSIIGSY